MNYTIRNFSLYPSEETLIKTINSLYPKKHSRNDKKKRRELFHLLVFLDLLGKYKKYKIEFSERPDFILKKFFFKKVGIEITEILDCGKNNKKLNDFLDILLEQSHKSHLKVIPHQQRSEYAKQKLKDQYAKKRFKLNQPDWKKLDKNILLLVTAESSDNPCTVTGFWPDRVFTKNEAIELKGDFSDVFILNYNASPKDSGPVLLDIDSIIENRTMLYGE